MTLFAGHPDLVPLGGLFLAIVGLAVLFGAALPRYRQLALWVGLAIGAAATVTTGLRTTVMPAPTSIQLGSLIFAVAAEIAAFVALMPRLYRSGHRAVVAGTLAIVGGHFAMMAPAFGPSIVALGLLCVLNAAALWTTPRYLAGGAWAVDGLLKLLVGLVMIGQ